MKFKLSIISAIFAAISMPHPANAQIDTVATDLQLLSKYDPKDSAPFLKKLDEELTRRKERQAKRETEIRKMKLVLYSDASSECERMHACSDLVRNYCSYQLDSAIHYAFVKKDLAIAMDDAESVMEAELNFAEALVNSGINSDLENVLDSLEQQVMSDRLYRYYLRLRILLYENIDNQTDNPKLKPTHLKWLYDALRALSEQQTPENSGFWYYHIRVKILDSEGRSGEARKLLENKVERSGLTLLDKANYYYRLGRSCELGAGSAEEVKSYFALAALADMEDADKEHYAIYRLAQILYGEGDIKRAYHYMKVAVEDATFSNSYKRLYRISQMIPVIDNAYNDERNRQQRMLSVFLGLSILLIITLTVTLSYIGRLFRSYRRATLRLSAMNGELKELTKNLNDSNIIKETYIVRYMNLYLDSINQMSTRLKRIARFMTAGNEGELRKLLDTSKLEQENIDIFYQNFDTTFLSLFPTFVEQYNELISPESRIVLKNPKRLNTELRIYALIRLGITDSGKISEFLDYSLSTIYNNRTAARNKAIVDRNRFEEYVAMIGKAKKVDG